MTLPDAELEVLSWPSWGRFQLEKPLSPLGNSFNMDFFGATSLSPAESYYIGVGLGNLALESSLGHLDVPRLVLWVGCMDGLKWWEIECEEALQGLGGL